MNSLLALLFKLREEHRGSITSIHMAKIGGRRRECGLGGGIACLKDSWRAS